VNGKQKTLTLIKQLIKVREKQQKDFNKIGDVCKTISRPLAVGNNSDKFVKLLFEYIISEMSSHSLLFVSNKTKVLF